MFKTIAGRDEQEEGGQPSFLLLTSDNTDSEAPDDFTVRPLHSIIGPTSNIENLPDYTTGLDLLVRYPYKGTAFDEPLRFIEHLENSCGKAFTAKASILRCKVEGPSWV